MKLSEEYIEKRINENTETIQVFGEFDHSLIYLILETGVNDDPINKRGLSHLCEHIFLESVSEEFQKNILDYNFNSMGYTEYSYTTFKFIVSNVKSNVKEILMRIDYFINNFNEISEMYFDKCKKDVIEECIQKSSDTEKSIKANRFITDNKFNYAPIGEIESIRKIEFEDVKRHYDKDFRIKLALFTNLEVNDIERLIDKKITNIEKNKISKKYIPKFEKNESLTLAISSQNEVRLYFKQKKGDLDYSEKVAVCILELIINLRICKLLKIKNDEISPVYFERKKFDYENIYNVVRIRDYKKNEIKIDKNFVDKLVNNPIATEEIKDAKYLFLELLNEIEDVNEAYIYNNIFHYFINNDLKIITPKQVKRIMEEVDKLKNDEIYRINKFIYTQNYKIVID